MFARRIRRSDRATRRIAIDSRRTHGQRLGDERQLLRLHGQRRPAQLLHALFRRRVRPAVHRRGTWTDDTVTPGATSAEWRDDVRRRTADLPPAKGPARTSAFGRRRRVNVRVGISYVSEANARANLAAENPRGTSFDDDGRDARTTPGTQARRGSRSPAARTDRAHHLLHARCTTRRCTRTSFSDANGAYAGFDRTAACRVGARSAAQYANFSGWDVYRSQLQLVTLLDPRIARRHRAVAPQPGDAESRRLGSLDAQRPGATPRDGGRPVRACRSRHRRVRRDELRRRGALRVAGAGRDRADRRGPQHGR